MLAKLKKSWNVVAQTGVWVMSIVAGFVVTPQLGGPQDEKSIWNLTQFVVNILVGLLFVLTIKYAKPVHLRRWVGLTVLTLLMGLFGYFSYVSQRGDCTCRYYQKTVLVGTHLRAPQTEDSTPCEELLKNHTGDVEEIWTKASLNRCRLILAISYVSTVPLFAVCLISVVQALYIASRGRPR
jgi:hypothetical protein